VDVLLAAARFAHYAAAIQLFGVAAFYWLLSPLQGREATRRTARITAIVSSILLLVSGIVWLLAATAEMGDGPADAFNLDVIQTVLGQTGFGRIWGPRLVVCALAVVATLIRADWAWWLVLLTATVALGSLGLIGHAAIDTGLLGVLNETSQSLHLLSSGFWLGALVPLVFWLRLFRDPRLEPIADLTLRRFSGLGHFAVAVLLLSGVANTWFVLGSNFDFAGTYEQLLLVKIGIAGLMCMLAIVNRYVFMPRIPHGGPGARQLARGTIAEIVLGMGIIALVGVIGMLSPT